MKPKIFNFKALPFERRAEIVRRIKEAAECADMQHFRAACRDVLGHGTSRKELRRVRARCIAYILQKRGLLAAA